MKNIVLVGPAYPYRGGIAQSQSLLFQHLSKKYNVSIVNFSKQYPDILFPGKSQYEEGADVFNIPNDKNKRLLNTVNPISWISTANKIASYSPDIVIFAYWMPFFVPAYYTISLFLKKLTKTKIIVLCHNIFPHEKQTGQDFLTKLFFNKADSFIVLSSSVEKDLKSITNKPFVNSPHPIYNSFGSPVSISNARAKLNSEYNISFNEKDNVILFFGFIRKYKGLNYLLDSMPEVLKKQSVKLLIVGEYYEDEAPYIEKIKNNGIEHDIVQINKYVPNEHIHLFFCSCNLVVQPYVSATQSGISQLSMYYNKPMISTDVGALSEVVIHDKTGYIVPPKDSKTLAYYICLYFEQQKEAYFSSEIELENKKYDWSFFIQKIEELF